MELYSITMMQTSSRSSGTSGPFPMCPWTWWPLSRRQPSRSKLGQKVRLPPVGERVWSTAGLLLLMCGCHVSWQAEPSYQAEKEPVLHYCSAGVKLNLVEFTNFTLYMEGHFCNKYGTRTLHPSGMPICHVNAHHTRTCMPHTACMHATHMHAHTLNTCIPDTGKPHASRCTNTCSMHEWCHYAQCKHKQHAHKHILNAL